MNIKETSNGVKNGFVLIELAVVQCPTDDELKELEDYLDEQEAIGPMLNPSMFQDGAWFDALRALKDRIKLIRTIRAALEEDKKACYEVLATRKKVEP